MLPPRQYSRIPSGHPDGRPARKGACGIAAGARAEIDRVQGMGGAIAAVESGYMKSQLVSSLAVRRRRIEDGDDVVVGVNRFTETDPSPLQTDGAAAIETVDPET